MAYIMHILAELDASADRCWGSETLEVRVGEVDVVYEGIKVTSLNDYEQSRFRDDGHAQTMVQDMRDVGDRPLDVLRSRGVEIGDDRAAQDDPSSTAP
jgi:hypothetical protein